jgi:tetratricopeptide (TPR) repeat protein
MKSTSIWFACFVALAALAASLTAHTPVACAADPAVLAQARALMYAATYDSVHKLVAAREELARLSTADPQSVELHYWVALASYRLTPRLMSKDKKQAKLYCEDGVRHLDQALAIDARSAECLALKGGLLGLAIGLAPMSAMSVGSEISELYGQARGIAPENPRVALMEGVNTYSKPGFVGGGAKKALPQLERAIALFATSPAGDSTSIDWGHDDAHIWAGRAAAKLKKWDEARGHYEKALEINPGNRWVRNVLLPQLDKLAGGTEGA